MRFILNNYATYSRFMEAAKEEGKRSQVSDAYRQACKVVLMALKADYENSRKAIGRSANRHAPLVENANIYLTAFELSDFARLQNDAQTDHFCRVAAFGALRLIEDRIAQELGRETLTADEDSVVTSILDDLREWVNEEANDAYQRAQF